MIITCSDGTVREFDTTLGDFVIRYTFPTATDKHNIKNFNNGVIVTNGVDDLVFYEHGRNTVLTGTLGITTGSNVIAGSGTLFTTQLVVGTGITINGNTYYVTEITSNTQMKVNANMATTQTGIALTLANTSLCNAYLVNSDDPTMRNPIRGLAIETYKGTLFVGGDDNILYYSQLGFYNKWDIKYDAGGFPPFYNDGTEIKALGLFSDALIIHRRDNSYSLSGGDTPSEWSIQPYANISCSGTNGYLVVATSYYTYSQKDMGIYPLLKKTIFSDKFTGDEISTKIRNYFTNIDANKLDMIFAVYNSQKKYIQWYMPTILSPYSNICLIYDMMTNSWIKREVPQKVTCAFEFNNYIYIGTDDGYILQEFTGNTFNGEPINYKWVSPWFDFGDGSNYLSLREFRIQVSDMYSNIFNVISRRNGTTGFSQREISNESSDSVSLVWGGVVDTPNNNTTWDDFNWADSGFRTFRFPLDKSYFQSIQIEFSGNGSGMAIYGFEFCGLSMEEVTW